MEHTQTFGIKVWEKMSKEGWGQRCMWSTYGIYGCDNRDSTTETVKSTNLLPTASPTIVPATILYAVPPAAPEAVANP